MNFCTSIHCMDGRIQEPIQRFLRKAYNAAFVDTITEPGPCKILAENADATVIESILRKVDISVRQHRSTLIAVSGHHDCLGNPTSERQQREQIQKSVELLKARYPYTEVIGLWIDRRWAVNTV
jgi:carbonic anhydrase